MEWFKLSFSLFYTLLCFIVIFFKMSCDLATSYHIEGLSPCVSRTATDPRKYLGSNSRPRNGQRRSQKLVTDTRKSRNKGSRFSAPPASISKLSEPQCDPSLSSTFCFREASARLPAVKLPKIWFDQIRLWFLLVENLFKLHGVSSVAKRTLSVR